MQVHAHAPFFQSLNLLWKKGGPYQKAATEIQALMGRIANPSVTNDPFHGLNRTRHGETRIKHCVKYDLQAFSRLITVQTDGYCMLLYAGSHDDCDHWLDGHRGFEPVVDDNNRAVVTFRSIGQAESERVSPVAGHYSRPLFERLPEDLYEALVENCPRKTTRAIERIDAAVTENDLWEIVGEIVDGDLRETVHDVFALLKADKVVEAVIRIRLHRGDLATMDSLSPGELPDIVDSGVIRRINPDSPQYGEALKRFMQSAKYRDWMLFMHPDQEAIVEEDFEGAAKLVGVSGSGKTCVIVKRAVRLALKYEGQRILILTLNRALAQLIDELVTVCAPAHIRQFIEVKPFFVLCQERMLDIDPRGTKAYQEVTWKGNEHVDEIWQEYYRCENNNYDARCFQAVHDSLLARGWNPERYFREEIDWLRSAVQPGQRSRYLDIERKGRKVPLSRPNREAVLEGASGWEDKMSAIGVMDTLGIAHAVVRCLPLLKSRYRCVLVDEVQDFGNVELEIVRALVPRAENDLFLAGDAAQAVTAKHQRLVDVGIDIPRSSSRELSQNYRNSSDVLAAAYHVLSENLTEDLIDREDLRILDPEASAFTGATPVLLEAATLELELRGAFELARLKLDANPDAKVCVALCGYSLYEISKFGNDLDVPVLDGTTSLDDGGLFLSDLPQTKGFEFDLVCILNCSGGVLPDRTAPDEERFRDLAALYVAMTRAKTDLVLSWSQSPSPFLPPAKEKFLTARWVDYVEGLDKLPEIALPPHIDAYREGTHRTPWRDMTGETFLLSEYALGMSVELSSKLRTVVDGVGLRKVDKEGRAHNLRWARFGQAVDAFRKDGRARRVWGPELSTQFSKLIARLRHRRVRPFELRAQLLHRRHQLFGAGHSGTRRADARSVLLFGSAGVAQFMAGRAVPALQSWAIEWRLRSSQAVRLAPTASFHATNCRSLQCRRVLSSASTILIVLRASAIAAACRAAPTTARAFSQSRRLIARSRARTSASNRTRKSGRIPNSSMKVKACRTAASIIRSARTTNCPVLIPPGGSFINAASGTFGKHRLAISAIGRTCSNCTRARNSRTFFVAARAARAPCSVSAVHIVRLATAASSLRRAHCSAGASAAAWLARNSCTLTSVLSRSMTLRSMVSSI
jgi:hypothetical protein